MKKLALILSFSALLASSYAVQAKPDRFQQWDKDEDGKVSVDEFTAKSKKKEKATKRFEKLDTDKDGYLSKEEAAQMVAKQKK